MEDRIRHICGSVVLEEYHMMFGISVLCIQREIQDCVKTTGSRRNMRCAAFECSVMPRSLR